MAKGREGVARPDGWVTLGLVVSAASAAVSSFSGLRSLALVTGWPMVLAPLLPLTIDSYAATSIRVWLAVSTSSERARRFARWNAAGAILLSLAGNAASHLMTAHLLAASWSVVLAVGAVPPVILGLVVELAVLRGQVDAPMEEVRTRPREASVTAVPDRPVVPSSTATGTSRPAVRTGDGTQYADEAELETAARAADEEHKARTGRPISRDELRRQLRIGGARATALLRQLRQEATVTEPGT